MNQQPTMHVVRRAPYIFLVALVAMWTLLIWVRPETKIFAASGVAGLAAFVIQRFFPRTGQDDVFFLSFVFFMLPGAWVTRHESALALALYTASFFVVVSGLNWGWNRVRSVRGRS